MDITIGSTGITVNKNGFGALPIQRISSDNAVYLLQKAYNGGITFFDTARVYSDSEEKVGKAFCKMRDKVIIASKTFSTNSVSFWRDIETSLKKLKTDYIDIYQFHNPAFCPVPGDESGLYDAMLKAKEKGMIRFIGISNHRLDVANQAIDSGLYSTLQFPFSYLSGNQELNLVKKCEDKNMGFIAMKSLAGGLITNSAAAYAFAAQFDNVLPIWGVQKDSELDEFLGYVNNPPTMTDDIRSFISTDKEYLSADFCRGCGYCMPCPVGIEICTCARMSLLIRRAPSQFQLTAEMQAKMKLIEECLHCGQCKLKCPYGLDTPRLLEENYDDYKKILAGERLPE